MADDPIRFEGSRELHKALKALEPAADKELRSNLKGVGEKVASEARANEHRGTGRYARSLKSYVTAKGVSVGSRLPQAGVLHWGGTIRPRGVSIVFPARPVVSQSLDHQTDRIVEELGDAVEKAARRVGWK